MMASMCLMGGTVVRKSHKGFVFQVLSILFSSVLCTAQVQPASKELPDVTLKTTSVAAFKNGLGFFVRQGAAHLSSGQGRILFVPEATLGSLWLAMNPMGRKPSSGRPISRRARR